MENVVENSTPKESIVFLHGLFGGLSNFEACISFISGDFDCFVPELPLYTTDKKSPLISLTEWLVEYIESHFPSQKVHLVGNSLGGQLAIMLALKIPDHIASITLTGSAGLGEKEFQTSFPKRFCADFIREKAAETFFDHHVDEELVAHISEIVKDRDKLLRLIRLAKDSFSVNLISEFPKIEAPVHLIWGYHDKITPLSQADIFQQKLNASLDIISDCGHAPMMEKPLQFAESLTFFLQRITHHEYQKNYSY